MKNLKAAAWIILLAVFRSVLNILGITIPLLMPFAAAAAFAENSFGYALAVGIICGVLEGSFSGSRFAVSVFVTTVLAVGIFNLKKRPVTAGGVLKMSAWTFLAIIFEGAISLLIKGCSFKALIGMFPYTAVMAAVGAGTAAAMYGLLKKTVYKSSYKTFVL